MSSSVYIEVPDDFDQSTVYVYGGGSQPGVPQVLSVSKQVVDYSGGSSIVISGSGFTGASSVAFGGTPATSFTVVNDSLITAVTPSRAPSPTPVDVNVGGGVLSSAVEFFSPQNISGLQQWLRGDRFVSSSAGILSKWGDGSSMGFDMLASVPTREPSPVTGINGKPAVGFGSQSSSASGTSVLKGNPPVSLSGSTTGAHSFVVCDDPSGATQNWLWLYGTVGTDQYYPLTNACYESAFNSTRPYVGVPAATALGTNARTLEVSMAANGDYNVSFNDTNYVGTYSGQTFGTRTPVELGHGLENGGGGYGSWRISEVAVWNRVLTTPERNRFLAYRSDRYVP